MDKKDSLKPASIASSSFIRSLANEVARLVFSNMPKLRAYKKRNKANIRRLEGSMFLDTSAIIDGRIFEVIRLGLHMNTVVIPEAILSELKNIADTQDSVKRERGRKGLEYLEKLKKEREVKIIILSSEQKNKKETVDEELIFLAKQNKGRVVTCDYNLEKRATIGGVKAININALAQVLKVIAVPGQTLHIRVLHLGKDLTQGVGYLDDGTMIVIEKGADMINQIIDVVVSRVIQTTAGRILFSKKI